MWCFRTNNTLQISVLQPDHRQLLCTGVQYTAHQERAGCFVRQAGRGCTLRRRKVQLGLLCFFMCIAAGLSAAGRPDAETAKAYFEIAQAYADVAQYDKAAAFYLKAAKDPEHKNAAEYNLARVYGLQGDWGKALPILERQYAESSGNVLILKAYAYGLASTGKHDRAVEMYRKLYDEDKENPDSALNYARILVFTKRYDEAQTLIEELKTVFAETNEKKVLDELEEKIKKAKEEPEKAEAGNSSSEQDATKTENPDAKAKTAGAAGAEDIKSSKNEGPAAEADGAGTESAKTAASGNTKSPGNTTDKPSNTGTTGAKADKKKWSRK